MSHEPQKMKFSVAIQTDTYQRLIMQTLKDPKRANHFIAAISSAVAVNPLLQECEAGSILCAALLGESLNLSPSPQLGQYYLVPYQVAVKDNAGKFRLDEKGNRITIKKAQFQLGYRGYIQLAIRSGYYKKLNVLAIKEGELQSFDPLEEEILVTLIEDEEQRENAKTTGYYAMFEYHNGFRKAIYWSKRKMEAHADKYSKAYSLQADRLLKEGKIKEKDMWKYSSFWYSDFDAMAKKTMLRQIISKWGIMSVDMQEVFEKDMSVINGDGSYEYADRGDGEELLLPIEGGEEAIPEVAMDEL